MHTPLIRLELALSVYSERDSSARRRSATSAARAAAALVVTLVAAPGAHAASIAINPIFKFLSCPGVACDSLTIQVSLSLGEVGADSFGFDINIDHAGLFGLAIGPVPGNPIAGMNGTLDLLANGTTLRGLLNSLPSSFSGPRTFDVATIPLQAVASGTAEFRFISAEIVCSLCNGGAGQFYPISNVSNQPLAQVVIAPEPGTFALIALGLAGLGASRRRRSGTRADATRGERGAL
jgi:hypothetical protein